MKPGIQKYELSENGINTGQNEDYQFYRKIPAAVATADCNRKNTEALRNVERNCAATTTPKRARRAAMIKEPSLDYEFIDRVCI